MTPAESIDQLVADGIVDALIQRVKTGKEAEVFIVRKGETYFAAKVYKERTARNFKNNVAYREGRQVRNTRDARAIAKGTRYGIAMAESDWRHTEHDALAVVANAGVRVPKPELFYEGVLLMELVLGQDGQPAPRLIDVPLSKDEAIAMHRDVVGQIVRMLTCDLIHGDLSPYNVLMAWNGPTIIDLPQVIKAAHNSQSEMFLVRDVRNVTEHFARYAPELKARVNDGYAIWRKYMRRDLSPDYFPDASESAQRPPRAEGARPHHGAPRPNGVPHAGDRPRPPQPGHQPQHGANPRPPPARPQQARGHGPHPQGAAASGGGRPNGAPRPPQGPPRHGQQNGRPAHQTPRRGSNENGTRPRHAPPGPVVQRVVRLAPPTNHGHTHHHGRPEASKSDGQPRHGVARPHQRHG
jgi:RIO kinase 1